MKIFMEKPCVVELTAGFGILPKIDFFSEFHQ
jgi:hypothetical protein